MAQQTPSPASVPPNALPLAEAAIQDDEPVIGISAGDRHRAYLVAALDAVAGDLAGTPFGEGQVINDMLGSVPVSITYCARTKNCRVLTRPGSVLLTVSVAGPNVVGDVAAGNAQVGNSPPSHSDSGLQLMIDGRRYRQDDPKLPLDDHVFETTRWGAWKKSHPDTDIYIGRLDEG